MRRTMRFIVSSSLIPRDSFAWTVGRVRRMPPRPARRRHRVHGHTCPQPAVPMVSGSQRRQAYGKQRLAMPVAPGVELVGQFGPQELAPAASHEGSESLPRTGAQGGLPARVTMGSGSARRWARRVEAALTFGGVVVEAFDGLRRQDDAGVEGAEAFEGRRRWGGGAQRRSSVRSINPRRGRAPALEFAGRLRP
jgi:hypothetical protein